MIKYFCDKCAKEYHCPELEEFYAIKTINPLSHLGSVIELCSICWMELCSYLKPSEIKSKILHEISKKEP